MKANYPWPKLKSLQLLNFRKIINHLIENLLFYNSIGIIAFSQFVLGKTYYFLPLN